MNHLKKQSMRWMFLFGIVFYTPMVLAALQTPEGVWTTVDDKTGQQRATVKLTIVNDVLSGEIMKLIPQPGDTGVCGKCPGEFKNQPIEGLHFLWGLKNKGHGIWGSGYILDAKNGKIYRVKLKVDGDKLYVRAYVGVSVLGRTQVWIR